MSVTHNDTIEKTPSNIKDQVTTDGIAVIISNSEYKFGTGEVITSVTSPNGEEIQITGHVDDAMALALESKGFEYTVREEKKLLWKVDLYLMPFFSFLYAIQYMDKISNSFASVMGIKTDLGMVGQMYSWLGTAFYLGYLVFEIPATLVLQKFPVAKATSLFIFIWAILVCLVPTAEYGGFVALRVLLGMVESAITPSMVIITSQWYKREEQFLRTAIWFASCYLGSIFGYAFAYGLYIHGTDWSIPSWKVVFIVIGLINVFLAAAFFYIIPDNPSKARFLNDREKKIIIERIRSNNQGFGSRYFKQSQLRECLLDYRIWLTFAFAVVDEVPNGGITNFSSILLNDDFGYSTEKSLLYNIPLGVVALFGTILMGLLYSLRIIKHRIVVALISLSLALIGSAMLAFCDSNPTAKLAGYYIMQVSDMGMICILSIYQSNVAGHTKKVVGNAIFLIGYCVGNIIGPQTFRTSEAPHYHTAEGAIVGCYAAAIVLLSLLYLSYIWENKKRDKHRAELGHTYVKIENIEFADLTDKENPEFRYSL